jgi:hypothetical protein
MDAALSGIRPRELNLRARKDLMALMVRRGMRLSGIDLFVPRRHFLDSVHQDRAVHATLAAIGLAADLGRVPLSISLPIAELKADVKDCLVEAADGHGVRLAVHAEDELDALLAWLKQVDLPTIGAALDPALIMAQSLDPATIASKIATRMAVARLNDQSSSSGSENAAALTRCPVGTGELDLVAYKISVDLATSRSGPVVLDLRGLPNPLRAASAAIKAWDDAAIVL